jgi:sigma-E factor negative regulatory protein RseA
MADQSIESEERVSALVDGQLLGDEFVQALADLESSSLAREEWDIYHVLGDVMRSNQASARTHDADFVRRLRQRISEATVEPINSAAVPIGARAQPHLTPASANDGAWRRVAGFASVALVAALAWQGLNWTGVSDLASTPQLAQQSGQPAANAASDAALAQADGSSALAITADTAIMIRDPQLDALLAAHRQFGGTSALQMPAGFLRNAAFAEGGR